jgi:hypothetical protein
MGYIPTDAKWYLADIVMEITIQGDSRNVVHVNTTLVRADSPNEAYDRAQELGKQGETSYENSHGQAVAIRFRGLRSLEVVYDELEHGAELTFSERIAVPEDEITKLITAKEQLEVFQPIKPSQGPDYGSRDVREEALRMLDRGNESK